MANIFPIDFEEKLTMAQDDYILFSDSEDGNKIKKAQYKNLKWEQGDPWTPWQDWEDGAAATITVGSVSTWAAWSSATVVNSWTSSAAVLDFTIPQWVAWTPWADWNDWAAATITVWTTTTLPAWSSATVENVWTSQDAILNFGIPKGDSWTWSWDVSWPASSTDGDLAMFDGATWKLIKDGWALTTKVFTLANTSDTTNAQAAYDWYKAGKMAVILYSGNYYFFKWTWVNSVYFAVNEYTPLDNTNVTSLVQKTLTLGLSWTTVTTISSRNMSMTGYNVLKTGKDYSTPYTPQYDGSPATKKYVDDGLSAKADSSSLGTAAACNTWTSSWNVPILDSNWKLATSTLPWVALTDTFTVSTSADLTTLSSADQWDIAIVTSENKTYVLSQAPYSTAANWKEILAPTWWVTSVNGQTWAVTLDADDISDSTTTNKFVTASDKTTWGNKQDALTLPATPTQWHLVTWGANNKTLVDWWAVPTGDVTISTQANNILTSWTKLRAGTQANYDSLGSYSNDTIYLTI